MLAFDRTLKSWLPFYVAYVLLALLAASAIAFTFRHITAEKWVTRAMVVTHRIALLDSLITHAETAQRDYLMTGLVENLAPYEAAVQEMPAALATVRRLTSDNPAQKKPLLALEKSLGAKVAHLQNSIELHKAGRPDAGLKLVNQRRAVAEIASIRRLVASMATEEHRRHLVRAEKAKQHDRIALAVLVASLLMMIALTLMLERDYRRRLVVLNKRLASKVETLQADLFHVARLRAMDTMASTLAHELNQPITAVLNYVEAVNDMLVAPDPDELPMIRGALEDAAAEAVRAAGIIRRVRSFVTRGDAEKTIEDLPELVKAAADLGLVDADEKGITVSVDLDPAASRVFVGKVEIQQVLINLIRNAVEAMETSAERHLSIMTRVISPSLVTVSVIDTGPGVPAEVADQLFKAFVTTKPDGMGLGLSICRTIIEANGGRIWLETSRGGGSAFHFTLVSAPEESDHD